jgi:hypothetical protein
MVSLSVGVPFLSQAKEESPFEFAETFLPKKNVIGLIC